MQNSYRISGVPTNIITGFLGAGKTTTILHLLKHKANNERWAVLVNEFGEIGIDGALFKGQHSQQQGVFIREVPGGCMCCTAGLPMQIALTQLLATAKPDRLLIEPTGLGHPEEVLHTLMAQNFRDILSIEKIVTLMDARHLSDQRYIEHETFQQQISIADVIVANKQDLYSDHDRATLSDYLDACSKQDAQLVFTEQGHIDDSLLNGPNMSVAKSQARGNLLTTLPDITHEPSDDVMPECGFIKAVNQGEGFVSIGWRFASHLIFDHKQLFSFLCGVHAERLKATFITNEGFFSYNLTRDSLTEMPLEHCDGSRIEIISDQPDDSWEASLFKCLPNQDLLKQKP